MIDIPLVTPCITPLVSSDVPATPPPAPELALVLAVVTARLEALETVVHPMHQAQREFLERVWYSGDPEATLVHLGHGLAIPCAAAGAERLGAAVAEELALEREVVALRDLKNALEDYEGGGRLTRAEVDGEGWDPAAEYLDLQRTQRPADIADPRGAAGQDYRGRLRAYAATIERELGDAIGGADRARLETLQAESAVVSERLRCAAGRRRTPKRAAAAQRGRPRDAVATPVLRIA